MIDFLGDFFGPYPFRAAGGIVDPDLPSGFDTQTRPLYWSGFWLDENDEVSEVAGETVVLHEIAHQWVGDSVSLERWQHLWLSEGWATYTEMMWADANDQAWVFPLIPIATGTVAELARVAYDAFPADHIFWNYTIGDPGPDNLFRLATALRGAIALQVLRETVGESAFSKIARQWYGQNKGGNVTTDDLIRLAERVSGQQLDDLFHTWLFTTEKPFLAPLP